MASTFTTNAFLQKPATADRYWDIPINANADFLDGIAAIGLLVVTPTEIPSATLNIRVTSGSFIMANGTVGLFPGVSSYTVPASASTCLWLTDSGILSATSVFPTTAHVRLAQVVAGPSTIQGILDARIGPQTCGTGLGFLLKSGDNMTGTLSVVSSTSGAPSLVVSPNGSATIGFFGTAPATQAPSLASLVDNTTGTASSMLADVGPSFSQVLIDANFATLAAKVNSLIAALKRHGLMSS